MGEIPSAQHGGRPGGGPARGCAVGRHATWTVAGLETLRTPGSEAARPSTVRVDDRSQGNSTPHTAHALVGRPAEPPHGEHWEQEDVPAGKNFKVAYDPATLDFTGLHSSAHVADLRTMNSALTRIEGGQFGKWFARRPSVKALQALKLTDGKATSLAMVPVERNAAGFAGRVEGKIRIRLHAPDRGVGLMARSWRIDPPPRVHLLPPQSRDIRWGATGLPDGCPPALRWSG